MKAPYLLVVVMLIALVRPVHGQEINIVTTLTTYGSIAREIVGDRAVVTSIARGDEDAQRDWPTRHVFHSHLLSIELLLNHFKTSPLIPKTI